MGNVYVAANHSKKQLFCLGKNLRFNEFYVDEFNLNAGLEKLEYPKTWEKLFDCVQVRGWPTSKSLDIAQQLFDMGIDIVLSHEGDGIYDLYQDRYDDYTYIGSVYPNDTDIGKTQHEIMEED